MNIFNYIKVSVMNLKKVLLILWNLIEKKQRISVIY